MNTTHDPARFARMSRDTARAKRIRDAYAIERCARPAHVIGSRVLYVLAALILIATVALLLTACGPSDTEAAQDTAADLQEAPLQARAEIHQAQALALLAARGHK